MLQIHSGSTTALNAADVSCIVEMGGELLHTTDNTQPTLNGNNTTSAMHWQSEEVKLESEDVQKALLKIQLRSKRSGSEEQILGQAVLRGHQFDDIVAAGQNSKLTELELMKAFGGAAFNVVVAKADGAEGESEHLVRVVRALNLPKDPPPAHSHLYCKILFDGIEQHTLMREPRPYDTEVEWQAGGSEEGVSFKVPGQLQPDTNMRVELWAHVPESAGQQDLLLGVMPLFGSTILTMADKGDAQDCPIMRPAGCLQVSMVELSRPVSEAGQQSATAGLADGLEDKVACEARVYANLENSSLRVEVASNQARVEAGGNCCIRTGSLRVEVWR